MHRVNKFHGPDKQVLADISLSFLPGAKIGVLGPNGAGKSTLLRIMAGLDEPSNGTAQLAPGATVGFLPQEPELDPAKDVRGNVEDGVAEKRDLLDTLQRAVGALRRADVGRRDGRAAGAAGRGAGPDRADGRLGPRARSGRGDGRAALPAARRRRVHAVRRRAPPGGALPAAALEPRPAAAGRAHQPPRRRVGGLAGAVPGAVLRDGARGHPRSLLPGQRRRLDPGARPRPRHPVPGQLLVVAGAEAGAAGGGGEADLGAPAHAAARAGVGADGAARAARQVEGAPGRLRAAAGRGGQRAARPRRDPHPGRRAPRRQGGGGDATSARASATGC